jgi:NADH-quinone oxidoreductase subunit N
VTASDLTALTPLLIVCSGILLLLLLVSFARNVMATFVTTMLIFLLAIGFVAQGMPDQARAVTSLLVVDGYSQFLSGPFLIAGAVTALLARGYLKGRGGEQEEFYLLLLLATLGAMTMASAQHFVTLILGLEILSISLYVLIGYSEEGHPPLEAAVKYLILSGVASTTGLFGIALIYIATGTLTLPGQADAELIGARADLYLLAGQGLLFAGLAFKLSLIPFHMWTPDVYQGAPAPVSGFLAAVSKGAVFAFLMRYALTTDILSGSATADLIALIAVVSMIGGNLLALMQRSVKRMLAYSSIAHLGYLLIALLAIGRLSDANLAVEAGLIYLTGYVLMTLAAFGVVATLSTPDQAMDADEIEAYEGLFWRHPLAASVLTVALLSLAGIPLTAGFIIKFYLFAAGVSGSMWLLIWAMVLGSALAIYYYLRIILVMTRIAETHTEDRPASADGLVVLVLLGISLITFGVFPSPLIDVVREVLGVTGS